MNDLEKSVREKYIQEGWTVLRDGWPDFLVFRQGVNGKTELRGIEVKSKTDVIRSNQHIVLTLLAQVMKIQVVLEGASLGDTGKVTVCDFLSHDGKRTMPPETRL